ncbi:hypothetical protein [Comamonas jiangduensis]|uniref:hypothetical protein n=1 Tax=Comamonas jiangduensis TaxID=1194168 RepID=UPI0028AB3654|nr:hypothetical protein [Comamonas jiangduensis]
MLDNIASSDTEIAKFLEITPQTLRKYRQKGQAPRLVMLALFWETVWGQSAANCDAVNWGRLQFQENAMLKRQNAKLKKQMAELEKALASVDQAANSPVFEIR